MTIVSSFCSFNNCLTGELEASKQAKVEKRIAELLGPHYNEALTSLQNLVERHHPRLIVALKRREPPLLHDAANIGHKGVVQWLLEFMPSEIDTPDRDGNTPIMHAAMGGHPDIIQMLLDADASLLKRNDRGCTALMLGAATGLVDLTKSLLGGGRVPNIDARDQYGNTALMNALLLGYANVARVLIVEGHADVTLTNNHGYSPLGFAASLGNGDLVALICEYGARDDQNVLDPEGNSPLILATQAYTRADAREELVIKAVDVLIDYNADVDSLDKNGRTALFHALRYKDAKVAEKLIEAGARLNVMSNKTIKELIHLEGFNPEIVKRLKPQFAAMDSQLGLDLMLSDRFDAKKIKALLS